MKELMTIPGDEFDAVILVEDINVKPKFYLHIMKKTGEPVTALKEFVNNFWNKQIPRMSFLADLQKYKIATLQQKEEIFKNLDNSWQIYKEKELKPKSKEELLEIIKLGTDLRDFHPAMTFGKTKAYFGTIINTEEEFKTKPVHIIVDSEGDYFELSDVELNKRRYTQQEGAEIMQNRWSRKGVQDFISAKNYDFQKLYIKIYDLLKKYMDFSTEEIYHLITTWIMGTYLHQLFNSYPYLLFEGYKASGKTKILSIIGFMAFNGIHSGNMSPSQLFRQVQGKRCTLLLDETEKLSNKENAPEFRNLLLNGYKKGGYIYRTGDSKTGFKTEKFEIFGPKALGNIAGVEDVLGSRCINIIMLKAEKGDPRAYAEPIEIDEVWQEVRDELHAFGLLAYSRVRKKYDDFNYNQVTENMSGRDFELWKPVFSLLSYFDDLGVLEAISGRDGRDGRGHGGILGVEKRGLLYDLVHRWAVTLIDERDLDSTIDETKDRMLRVICIQTQGDEWIGLKQIVEWCRTAIEDCPEWVTSKWVSATLKKFGFHKRRLVRGLTEILIDNVELDNVRKRYVEPLPVVKEEQVEGPIINTPPSVSSSTSLTSLPENTVCGAISAEIKNNTKSVSSTHHHSTRQICIEFLQAVGQKEPASFQEIRTHVELLSGPNKESEVVQTLAILAKEGIAFQPKVDGWVIL